MRGLLRFISLGLAGAGALGVACSVYTPSLLESDQGSTFDPASCKWGSCWWSGGTCDDVSVPGATARPAKAPDGDVGDIYLGVRSMYLGETAPPGVTVAEGDQPYQYFGLNLDGKCTNPMGCLDVANDDISCQGVLGTSDGYGCRDNVFGMLERIAAGEPDLGIPFGINENAINCELHRGSYSILFKISGYNGEADDENVRIDVYNSPGTIDYARDWNCGSTDAQGNVVANTTWAEQASWLPAVTRWYVDEAGLEGPIEAPGTLPGARANFDSAAFVKNYYLVARLPDREEIRLIGDGGFYPGFPLVVGGTVVVGYLHRDKDQLWALDDALIAGRLAKNDLEMSFRRIGFCESTSSDYPTLIQYLNSNMDVLANGAVDPEATCDAMSMGLGFRAQQIVAGEPKAVSRLEECTGPVGP